MGPQENVEIVRRMSDRQRSFWAGGVRWQALVGEFYDPNVDYYPARKWPESRPCHGVDDVERFFEAMSEAWLGMRWDILHIEAISDDRVLLRASLKGAGRGSGLELSGDVYFCYWLRNGVIFRQEDHLTPEGARRGLGLAE
jgi:SnoaL-like protein